LFVTDRIGLIIASCNVLSIVLLIYLFLEILAGERSRLFVALDKIFTPILFPLRRVAPDAKFDYAPIVLAVILQAVSLIVGRGNG